ncbi:core capsid protein [Nephila clavipes virus 6]|uniref:core capsid protein n=1 Tax=Nephila clavipes virus 6 TaxID=2108203 RepID=UPI000D219FDD|nr:core capsid protein [Nephila clavipes virus 6]AVK59489.1 core capsid protein [Nephila clavipes virus 6]
MDCVFDIISLNSGASVVICIPAGETLFDKIEDSYKRKFVLRGEAQRLNNQGVYFKELNINELYKERKISPSGIVSVAAQNVISTKITDINPWVNRGIITVLLITMPNDSSIDYWRAFFQCIANMQYMSYIPDYISLEDRSKMVRQLGQYRSLILSTERASGSSPFSTYSNAYRFALMSHACTIFSRKEVIIVGFHPIFAKFALQLGIRLTWVEVNSKPMITARLNAKALSTKKDSFNAPGSSIFVKPDGESKLGFFADALVYNYDLVIYIGAYPGAWFKAIPPWVAHSKRIYLIDPAFPEDWSYPGVSIIKDVWKFDNSWSENLARLGISLSNVMMDKIVICDDTWIPGRGAMAALLPDKISTLSVAANEGIDVFIKFNAYEELRTVLVPRLESIMWLPFMGDSNESRLKLSCVGGMQIIRRSNYLCACLEWRNLSHRDQVYESGRFLYAKSIIEKDMFTLLPSDIGGKAVIAPFSITNTFNATNFADLARKVDNFGSRCANAGVPFYTDLLITERIHAFCTRASDSSLNITLRGDTITSGASYHRYVDYHMPLHALYSLKHMAEVPLYAIANDILLASGVVHGYDVISPLTKDNVEAMHKLNFTQNVRAIVVNDDIFARFLIQDVRSSLGYRLKNLTSIERGIGLHSISSTYEDRANILANKLLSISPPDSIVFSPRIDKPVIVNQECIAVFSTCWESRLTLPLRVGEYDISGHLLNLLAHTMYEPVSIQLWHTQAFANYRMIHTTDSHSMEISQRYQLAKDAGLIVETCPDEVHVIWHKWNDYLFALIIADDYLKTILPPSIMNDNTVVGRNLPLTLGKLWSKFAIRQS